MTDSDKKLRGRPQSIKSHEAILRATLELLAEVGYDRTSIESVALRAGVGKTTIYRRYKGKAELVADAIENMRQEVVIPNTGGFWGDIEALIEGAASISLTGEGRRAVAMIVGSAASNPEFARIYWEKYLRPRREAFAVVIERARARGEIAPGLEPGLVFDTISSIMLYAMIFPPETGSWQAYVGRALKLLFATNLGN